MEQGSNLGRVHSWSKVQAMGLRLPQLGMAEHDLCSSKLSTSVENTFNVVREGWSRKHSQHFGTVESGKLLELG